MKKVVAGIIGILGFLYILGVAGSYDFADEVVYSMDDQVYELIIKKIGKTSNKDVANEYLENREYYDSYGY
jgi:hypothetical protein